MRRLSAAALSLVLFSGCWWWAVPYAGPAMPEGRAVELSYEYTRGQGYNPTGTRYARYNYRAGFWRVSLWLGPPSCGAVRMDVNAFNGVVFNFVPFVRPCGGPPPVIEEDRSDF